MSTATRVRVGERAAVQAELDSPAAAQRALDQAALIRSSAADARKDGAALVDAARDALTAAERRARVLGWIADVAEPLAVEFETRARVIGHVRSFREQLAAAQATLGPLETEFATLTERASELERRVADLDTDRGTLATRLTEARSSGKVGDVGSLRSELAAVEEVAADLRGQLQSARARLAQIGEPGSLQLLDQARRAVEQLRVQHAQGIDALGPDTDNELVRPMVVRLLNHGEKCEGETEKARHTEILAVLDGEPGFTAIMRGARDERAAIERRNRGEGGERAA